MNTQIHNLSDLGLAVEIEKAENARSIALASVLYAELARRNGGRIGDLREGLQRMADAFECDRCDERGQVVEVFA
jgi:hypothetical protein